jgi:hypothetical protein
VWRFEVKKISKISFEFEGSWDKLFGLGANVIVKPSIYFDKSKTIVAFCSYEVFDELCKKHPELVQFDKEVENG